AALYLLLVFFKGFALSDAESAAKIATPHRHTLHRRRQPAVRASKMKKLLFDLFPLILFFLAFRYADIFTATAVAMIAGVAQIAWLKLRGSAIETMHWVNLTIIIVF